MTWGSGPTSHLLFASSEPNGKGRLGFHRAFNVDAQTLVHEFDLRDPGDAIALDNEGRALLIKRLSELTPVTGLRLAVITNGDEHLIRVFDARGSSKDAMQCTHLETSLWPPSFNWDVNSASYSPDGLYLVVARSDNISHVYDSRVLEKGPMHTFEHRGSRRDGPGSGPFGVTDARWVETPTRRKLGLVTGGIDGSSPTLSNDPVANVELCRLRSTLGRHESDRPS
jgi:WD40 repeat protein